MALLLLTGCGSGDSDSSGPDAGASAQDQDEAAEDQVAEQPTITIRGNAYQGPESVAAGDEITVTNEDGVGHTVTSDEEGIFDVEVPPGETVTFAAPEEPGEYGFFCIPHPQMTDTLIVE